MCLWALRFRAEPQAARGAVSLSSWFQPSSGAESDCQYHPWRCLHRETRELGQERWARSRVQIRRGRPDSARGASWRGTVLSPGHPTWWRWQVDACLRSRNDPERQRNIKAWRLLPAIVKLKKNILEELETQGSLRLLDQKNKKDNFLSGTIYQTSKAMWGCYKGI